MKKLIMLFYALQCIFLFSCRHNDANVSIQYKDNDDAYSMDARFGRSKTWRAERYMNEVIGRQNNISFLNTRTDAVLTLDDGSKFYIKKSPGHIVIKMNKEETSDQAYQTLKSMCRGMKDVILQ